MTLRRASPRERFLAVLSVIKPSRGAAQAGQPARRTTTPAQQADQQHKQIEPEQQFGADHGQRLTPIGLAPGRAHQLATGKQIAHAPAIPDKRQGVQGVGSVKEEGHIQPFQAVTRLTQPDAELGLFVTMQIAIGKIADLLDGAAPEQAATAQPGRGRADRSCGCAACVT